MKIVINDGVVENWNNYSTQEKQQIATELQIISSRLLYERVRLIEKPTDIKEDDKDFVKDAAKNIGKEITTPTKGIVIGIEETLEDYYYIVQNDTDIDFIALYIPLK